jgi:hypothetical protein
LRAPVDRENAAAVISLKALKVEIALHGKNADPGKLFYEFVPTSLSGKVIRKKRLNSRRPVRRTKTIESLLKRLSNRFFPILRGLKKKKSAEK